jgi:hypothetical protein
MHATKGALLFLVYIQEQGEIKDRRKATKSR